MKQGSAEDKRSVRHIPRTSIRVRVRLRVDRVTVATHMLGRSHRPHTCCLAFDLGVGFRVRANDCTRRLAIDLGFGSSLMVSHCGA